MQVWRWDGFFDSLLNTYLLEGAIISVGLTVASLLIGLAIGIALALMRLSGQRVMSGFAAFYCWLFRGTPLLVQLLHHLHRPAADRPALRCLGGRADRPVDERGRLSVRDRARRHPCRSPSGQQEAARALGLRRAQVFRLVTWPQALRVIIPPLGNSVNGLLKTTSIASVISVDELLRRTQLLIQERFLVLELFTVAALYYLVLTTLWDFVQRRLERHYGRGDAMDSADRR